MRSILHHPACRVAPVVIACLMCAAVPLAARGDEPAAMSREELVRKWDLNSDGSIDEGEAEVARSRMRRDRAELQMKSGTDPLTGKPRIIAADEAEATAEQPETERPRTKSAAGEPGLPGTRVPDAKPPIPATRPPAGRAGQPARGGGPAGAQRATGPSAAPAANPTAADPGIVTGGARAGAAARPGYGARLPRPDLNAGRLPAGLPGRRPAPASGGLLPNLRRPPVAPVSPPSPARRTVDDFDVY